MPILGIYASSMQPALNATSYESIATVTVGAGGSSSISFTSIPSTYKHLQIRGIGRTARSNADDNAYIRFNSDTGNNYAWHSLYGTGSGVTAYAVSSTNYGQILATSAASTTASVFNGSVIDILDYANTSKYKTVRALSGFDANGSGIIYFNSALWQNTNAITQIDLAGITGSNWAQYSSFALYGIKG